MTEIEVREAVPPTAVVGQATAIEQARAVAEVQGAIVVAQQCPRNMQLAMAAMRESCGQKALAERAFFRYSRGGGAITGPTVHMARELARCFGNMQYGISELRRDDVAGESEMQAWAWDVQMNTRASTTFIVKHARDTKTGVKKLTDTRDIYENNANMGARRLREQIFAILPTWFTEEAKDRCQATLENGGGKPMAARVADLLAAFAAVGVTADQLEQKQGRTSAQWTELDIAALTVVGKSIKLGEITVEEEFPTVRVTADEIRKQREPDVKAAASTPDPDPDPEPEPDWTRIEAEQAAARAEAEQTPETTNGASVDFITPKQMPMLQALMNSRGVRDQGKRHRILSNMVSRELASTKELTKDEATMVIDTINAMTPDSFAAAFGDI